MSRIQFTLILLVAFCFTSLPKYVNAGNQNDINDAIGAYNHLTISLTLLRHGVAASNIRQDTLSNVALSKLTPELQEDYKTILQLADKMSVKESEMKKQHQTQATITQKKAKDKETSNLFKLGIAAYTGGTMAIAPLIFKMISSPESDSNQQAEITSEQVGLIFCQEISKFEFNIALKREQLVQMNGISQKRFVRPVDIDKYLNIIKGNYGINRRYKELSILHQNCPALYMVGYELGIQALKTGDYESSTEYFQSVVDFSPSILRRIRVRSYAYAFLGMINVEQKNYDSAFNNFAKALEEKPENDIALLGRATCYQKNKRYDKAILEYEKALLVSGDSKFLNYNYACSLAMAGRSTDLVIEQLRRAMSAGFCDIKHAKSDPELDAVKDLKSFKELVTFKFNFDFKWNNFSPEVLGITNVSSFDITNIRFKILFKVYNANGKMSKRWYYDEKSKLTKVDRIKSGGVYKFNVFDYQPRDIAYIQLQIECDQGHTQTIFANNRGNIQVYNHKVL